MAYLVGEKGFQDLVHDVSMGDVSPMALNGPFRDLLGKLGEADRADKGTVVDGLVSCIRASDDFVAATGLTPGDTMFGVEELTHFTF